MKNYIQDVVLFLKVKNSLIWFAVFFMVVSFGFEIVNFTLSIDEEIVNYRGNDYAPWYIQGRIAIGLIKFLLLNTSYLPFLTSLLAAICFTVSALLWCHLFNSLLKGKIQNVSLIIFIGFYLSFPTVNASFFSFNTYNLEITIGMLLIPVSLYFVHKATVENTNSSLIISTILFAFTLSLYQAFAPVFIMGIFIVVWGYLYQFSENNRLKFIYKAFVVLISGSILYFIIKYIFEIFWPSSSYVENFIRWGTLPNAVVMKDLYNGIKAILINWNFENVTISITIIALLFIGIITFFNKNLKNKLFLILLYAATPLIPFTISIVTGGILPYRALLALPLMAGFIWLVFSESILQFKKYKIILMGGAFVLLFSQIQIINAIFYGDNLRYEMDKNIGNLIATDVMFETSNEKKPIIFIGAYSHESNPRIVQYDTLGASFFEWDEGRNHRIHNFLKIQGYKFIEPTIEEVDKMIEEIDIENIPNWPLDGSIIEREDYIIVKLSNPSPYWYSVNSSFIVE